MLGLPEALTSTNKIQNTEPGTDNFFLELQVLINKNVSTNVKFLSNISVLQFHPFVLHNSKFTHFISTEIIRAIQTEYKPSTNRVQTEYKPSTNRVQAEYKPSTNRVSFFPKLVGFYSSIRQLKFNLFYIDCSRTSSFIFTVHLMTQDKSC